MKARSVRWCVGCQAFTESSGPDRAGFWGYCLTCTFPSGSRHPTRTIEPSPTTGRTTTSDDYLLEPREANGVSLSIEREAAFGGDPENPPDFGPALRLARVNDPSMAIMVTPDLARALVRTCLPLIVDEGGLGPDYHLTVIDREVVDAATSMLSHLLKPLDAPAPSLDSEPF